MSDNLWSDESVREAVRLWNRGYSITRVASEIGRTRGSVAGMLHRFGLVGEIKPRGSKERPKVAVAPPPTKAVHTKKALIDQAVADVCDRHAVSVSDVIGRSELRHITRARQAAYFEIYTRFGLSSKRVGRHFDNRDPGTVYFGIRAHCARSGIDFEEHRRPVRKSKVTAGV